MTYRILTALMVLLMSSCFLFQGRKKREIISTDPLPFSMMKIGGVPVYMARTGDSWMTLQVCFRGGVMNFPERVEGIEYLSLKGAAECGTLMYSPPEWKSTMARLGANIRVESRPDHSSVGLSCAARDFPLAWDFYIQSLINPTLQENCFHPMQGEEIKLHEKQDADPVWVARNLQRDAWLTDHPYGRKWEGSAAGLKEFTFIQAQEYFHALCGKARMFVVVTGAIDTAKLREKLEPSFALLPDGFFESKDIPPFPTPRAVSAQAAGTPVLRMFIPAPPPRSRDRAGMELALQVMCRRYRETGKGVADWKYAPNRRPAFMAEFILREPDAFASLASLLRTLHLEGVSEYELEREREFMITHNWLLLQDTDELASRAAEMIAGGDEHPVMVPEGDIRAADKTKVDAVFHRYYAQASWSYAGDTLLFDPAILNFAP